MSKRNYNSYLYKEAESLGIGAWNFDSWSKYWVKKSQEANSENKEKIKVLCDSNLENLRKTKYRCSGLKFRGEIKYVICKKCHKRVKIIDSKVNEAYAEGKVSKEHCKFLLKLSHFRHAHTKYDEIRKQLILVNKSQQYNSTLAHKKARLQARQIIQKEVSKFIEENK